MERERVREKEPVQKDQGEHYENTLKLNADARERASCEASDEATIEVVQIEVVPPVSLGHPDEVIPIGELMEHRANLEEEVDAGHEGLPPLGQDDP